MSDSCTPVDSGLFVDMHKPTPSLLYYKVGNVPFVYSMQAAVFHLDHFPLAVFVDYSMQAAVFDPDHLPLCMFLGLQYSMHVGASMS